MYLSLYVSIFICIYLYMYLSLYVSIFICIYFYMYLSNSILIYISLPLYVYLCIHLVVRIFEKAEKCLFSFIFHLELCIYFIPFTHITFLHYFNIYFNLYYFILLSIKECRFRSLGRIKTHKIFNN